MTSAISVQNLHKTYDNGFKALDDVSLDVERGEIVALLGPNGAGKTTLISTICGIVNATSGKIDVFGYDNQKDYRKARSCIGLVPQELTTDAFETVWHTVSFSRHLFGKSSKPEYIESLLKSLSLWDKKDNQIRMLSGGMKRRVMIAKALSHEPDILFLDEPTAGVDVELRKSMWQLVRKLRETGVTIILTTHYLEEAEEMADRIGVINNGKMIVIEDKKKLMKKLGKKELVLELYSPISEIPEALSGFDLHLKQDGHQIIFTYDPAKQDNGVVRLLDQLKAHSVKCKDFNTRQSTLEEIFVQLIGEK
ncbi:MAG: ABC transporter ATP-binding protein [Alphaproteobacteria bacterium]|nr:ABC transporter ATP-binding protein [Alphaproteobacteria bacterium]HPF46963.1 ABC transporter ATP-binding protein [Emcibacteraceae bacterium]HRW29232.1 ABC transporter ATP-binding protein [Emcibacteraceae bacterium]